LSKVYAKGSLETTELAKRETLELLVNYLPKRFPKLFLTVDSGLYNTITKETITFTQFEDPLLVCAYLVCEDFVIMEYSPTSKEYVLSAGVVCFPLRWTLSEKLNMPMTHIHEPVNAYGKYLSRSVTNLFDSIEPSQGFCRGNWALFDELKDPLDLFTPTGHNERALSKPKTEYGPNTGKEILGREEWQTLIKLPKSNAILFTIRTYQWYLEEMKQFPELARGLVAAIENLQPDMAIYKSSEFWKDATLTYLKNDVLSLHSKL